MANGYESETKFVAYLKQKLKKEGYDCQRIESGSTGLGIPDLFVQGHGTDFFIEAKNVKRILPAPFCTFTVPWRPGQLAWALRYEEAHCYKKVSWTACAFTDGVIFIPMTHRHIVHNMITFSDSFLFKFEWRQFREIKIGDVICAYTQQIREDSIIL